MGRHYANEPVGPAADAPEAAWPWDILESVRLCIPLLLDRGLSVSAVVCGTGGVGRP